MQRVTRSRTGTIKQKPQYTSDSPPSEPQEEEKVQEQKKKISKPKVKTSTTTTTTIKKRSIKPSKEEPPRKKKQPKVEPALEIIDQKKNVLKNLRPSYMARPKKYDDNEKDYLFKCEALITSNLLQLDTSFKDQIDKLKKYTIFKDLSKIDVKTVKILQSDIGEMNERDEKLKKLMTLDITSKEFNEGFEKLYGLTNN